MKKSDILRTFTTPSYKRTLLLIGLLILTFSVPLTLTLIQNRQDLRQFAQIIPNPDPTDSCRIRLAVPPRSFPTDIDYKFEGAGKTKENFNKLFDKGDLRDPNDGGYTDQDLPRPAGGRDSRGRLTPNTCYLNNHPYDIDDSRCGATSYYFTYARCAPSGSWRPVRPHGPLPPADNSEGNKACTGEVDPLDSNILVNFRERVRYNRGQGPITIKQARQIWNRNIAEIRSGNTTFGQMYSYDDDLNFAAEQIFGLSFNEVIDQEKNGNCAMDSWEYVCRSSQSGDGSRIPVKCANGARCSNDGDDRTYMCSNYSSNGTYPDPIANPPPRNPDAPVSVCSADGVYDGPLISCKVHLSIPPKEYIKREDYLALQQRPYCQNPVAPSRDKRCRVSFRGRVDYGRNLVGRFQRQGARVEWNYVMREVKAGYTDFGYNNSYESDLDYIAREYFGMSYKQLINTEIKNKCSTDSWDYVCTSNSGDERSSALFDGCRNSQCNSHQNARDPSSEEFPPPMACDNYVPAESEMSTPGLAPNAYTETNPACEIPLAVPPKGISEISRKEGYCSNPEAPPSTKDCKTSFRARVDYGRNIRQRFPTKGARVEWNYVMAEVKTGFTDFGALYSYEDDLNYIARKYFNKSFADLQASETANGCKMDSWPFVCRNSGGTGVEDMLFNGCKRASKCEGLDSIEDPENAGDDQAPRMVCDNYRPSPAGQNSCAKDSPPVGYLESVSCNALVGWACDPDKPGESLEVQLFKGPGSVTNLPFSRFKTDKPGNDVAEFCGGVSGNYRFYIQTPPSLKDAKPYEIFAYALNLPDGTSNLLKWKPDPPGSVPLKIDSCSLPGPGAVEPGGGSGGTGGSEIPNTGIGLPSQCSGTQVSFNAPKKLLPLPSQGNCANTLTESCGRPGRCVKPNKIVLHITAGILGAEDIYQYFSSGANGNGVGSHFMVASDGKVLQMVEMFQDKVEVAYAVANYGDHISIEIGRRTVFSGKDDVPPAQHQATVNLVRALVRQYNIPLGNLEYTWTSATNGPDQIAQGILGHYQLNPYGIDKRTDPGAGYLRDIREELRNSP